MTSGYPAGLLDGVRVLDLSVWRPGPYATQLLAEIGADVLKIEPPGGDPMRSYPGLFASVNANKRSIVLNLKTDADRARALELAGAADVVVEGFRPGVAARLGVSYDDVVKVNRGVVYCSLSGMGQSGPLSSVSGHDLNYQAWTGILAPEGDPPVVPAVPVADLAGGMAAAFGICAALVRHGATGEGEYIDLAMADVLATWTGAVTPEARDDDQRTGVPGYGVFECADGRILTLGIVTEDTFWGALCRVLGLDQLADLSFADRLPRVAALQSCLAEMIATRDRDELVTELLAADVPVAPVNSRAEMLATTHFRERGVVTSDPWADPAGGYPVRFDRHPSRRHSRPPELDQHRWSGFQPRTHDAAGGPGSPAVS